MVSENGNISQIDFLIDTVGQGTLTLAIYKGDGVAGTKVYQQEISGMVEGWNSFELNQPVAANAGETFTFQLSASEAGTILEYCDGWAFDCYEAGNLYWWQGAGNSDDYSLAFKVFIAGITEANPVVVTAAGQLGLGTATPKAPIHVNNGDVYLDTIGKGVILKSANGSCWRWIPANDGSIQSESVACP